MANFDIERTVSKAIVLVFLFEVAVMLGVGYVGYLVGKSVGYKQFVEESRCVVVEQENMSWRF